MRQEPPPFKQVSPHEHSGNEFSIRLAGLNLRLRPRQVPQRRRVRLPEGHGFSWSLRITVALPTQLSLISTPHTISPAQPHRWLILPAGCSSTTPKTSTT